MKRRHAILLLGGASSGAMSVGSGAFSSVEADRGVDVNVVDDDEAYLGIDVVNRIATVDRSTEVVEITNSFASTLSLDVTVDSMNNVVDTVRDTDSGDNFSLTLDSGESAPVAITCGQTGEATFTLSFSGETDSATVEKTRTFNNIECVGVSDVIFKGNGAVKIKGEFTGLEVTVNTVNGGSRNVTISSGNSPHAIITKKGGNNINSVTIDGTTYD